LKPSVISLAQFLGFQAETMARYAQFTLIPAFVSNVTSQSSISLLMTLTMAGQCVLTHDMVSIGTVIVGKIFGRSLEVISVFIMFVVAGNFGLSLLDFRFEET
jgi:hypothetical protein